MPKDYDVVTEDGMEKRVKDVTSMSIDVGGTLLFFNVNDEIVDAFSSDYWMRVQKV